MSREDEFHKLIEQQNADKKRDLWNALESKIDNKDFHNVNEGNVIAVSQKKQKIAIFSAAVCFVVICALVIGLVLGINKKTDNFIDIRYCTENDYYVIETETNIKQYSADNNKNLLFFDWYDNTEYALDKQFRLNTTDEVICLYEESLNENDVYLTFYITDNKTELDVLTAYSNLCKQVTEINSVKVNWCDSISTSLGWFEYSGYKYYLSVEDGPEQDYVLTLISELLDM